MPDLKAIFANFENLGDNCELGIAQRKAGIEPLGLLRFAGTPFVPSLIAAIDTEFATFGDRDDVELFGEDGGYCGIHIKSFHVIYATPTRWGALPADVVLNREIARIEFLKRKLIEDLQNGNKIFVRKGPRGNLGEIQALNAALRRLGPNTLLWVTEADEGHPNGSVEIVADGLISGRIQKFAPTEDVPSLRYDDWAALCTRIYGLWENKPAEAAATGTR